MEVMPRSKYKLVFVGDSNVGKTSIISRFMYDHFDENYDATIGIDFLAKTHTVKEKTVRLQLWDTAGQERFRSLIPSYIRDSSVAVVVYAIDNPQSFHAVDKWVDEVRAEREEQVIIFIVGNKTDLEGKRRISPNEGRNKAKNLNAYFLETSAKENDNIDKLFDEIAERLPDRQVESRDNSGNSGGNRVELSTSSSKKGGCC